MCKSAFEQDDMCLLVWLVGPALAQPTIKQPFLPTVNLPLCQQPLPEHVRAVLWMVGISVGESQSVLGLIPFLPLPSLTFSRGQREAFLLMKEVFWKTS